MSTKSINLYYGDSDFEDDREFDYKFESIVSSIDSYFKGQHDPRKPFMKLSFLLTLIGEAMLQSVKKDYLEEKKM